MNYVSVKLIDGATISGQMWEWRPLDGWFSVIVDGPDDPKVVKLVDCVSAIERDVWVTKDIIQDVNLLVRAHQDGWRKL